MVLLTTGYTCDKLEAHIKGLKHYALSILIFNKEKELLLQKRAKNKYHSGGLWTNTCCTHPLSEDSQQIKDCAESRLMYEMGLSCKLDYVCSFSYKEACEQLIENELDYVFIGYSDCNPRINLSEVCDFKWSNLDKIDHDRVKYPQNYTPWFHILLDQWKLYRKK